MAYRFAYSTNAYTKWPLDRAIADIRRQGFKGVEILVDTPHAVPGDTDPDALVAVLKKNRLAISNLNVNTSLALDREGRDPGGFWPSLIDPDEGARRRKIDYVIRAIDFARQVGAENIAIASGRKPARVPRGAAEALLMDSLEDILVHAERKPGVKVGIEYEPGFFIGNAKSLVAVLDELGHPLLGANLDIGHAVCVREDPAETIAALGTRIWNIHLEDIRKRVHDHLIPGLGDIDFAAVRRALDRAKYARFLTLELYPYKDEPGEAGRRGLDHLRPLFA